MIFSIEGHIEMVIAGTKTRTTRDSDRYKVGKLYVIQPKRTAKGISDGKIYIGQVTREWKPDFSDLPTSARFARQWRAMEAGYPIRPHNAKAEGGYTPEEFEKIYEEMYPNWDVRWAYDICFFTTEEIERARKFERETKWRR
jgi:hypothetical protein